MILHFCPCLRTSFLSLLIWVSWLPQFQEGGKAQVEMENGSTFVIWQKTNSLFWLSKLPGNTKWANYTSRHQYSVERSRRQRQVRSTVRRTTRMRNCSAARKGKPAWGICSCKTLRSVPSTNRIKRIQGSKTCLPVWLLIKAHPYEQTKHPCA